MSTTRHYSQLYRQLRSIDPRDHQRVIRTYEEREAEIGRLDTLEYFELTVYYVDALFATGAYREHQLVVDRVLETCILHNIRRVEGLEKDVFEHLLFSKAASAYRTQNFPGAAHVLRELIGINPGEELNVRFLRAALFKLEVNLLQFGRAAFIFCMLLAAALIVVELLVVRTLYENWVSASQTAIAVVFLGGVLLLTLSYALAYGRAHRAAYRFRATRANK